MSLVPSVNSINNTPLPIPVQIRAKAVTSDEARLHSLAHYVHAPEIAYKAILKQEGTAYDLAALDDGAKSLAVIAIATITSMGSLIRPGQSIPIWLGAAGWLIGMRLLPRAICYLTQLKTGVSAYVPYKSSQNDIRNMMDNPDYMPVQVLSPSLQTKLSRRYGIPLNSLNQQEQLQAKLKQISVQAHTWWMLMAGPFTPLFASMFCDRLEAPAQNFLTSMKANNLLNKTIQPILNLTDPKLRTQEQKALSKGMEALTRVTIDSGEGVSLASLWWQRFPDGVLKILGLDEPHVLKRLDVKSVIEEARFNKLSNYLCHKLSSLKVREELESYLLKQNTEIIQLLDPLIKTLRSPKAVGLLQPAQKDKLLQQARLSRGRAQATISQFLGLLDVYEKYQKASPSILLNQLKQHMEKPTIGYIEQLVREGSLGRAKELCGKYYTEILKLINKSRFIPAQNLVGEAPRDLLLRSTQALARRQNWLRWFPTSIGSAMAVSTVLYTAGFLGEDWLTEKAKGKQPSDEGGAI